MGEPVEAWAERIDLLMPYQVTTELLDRTGNPAVKFMHCLPAFHDRQTEVGEQLFQQTGLDGAGGHRRGLRVAALDRLRPGREPDAHHQGRHGRHPGPHPGGGSRVGSEGRAPLCVAGSEPCVPDAQARLRRLLEANRQAVEHLDLSTVLRQIVEAAVEMVGAQFGALGVLGSRGNLDQFIHVGMDPRDRGADRVRPGGPGPARRPDPGSAACAIATMVDDLRSVGFHRTTRRWRASSACRSRCGARSTAICTWPTLVRPSSPRRTSTRRGLAATAGVAISHARLFEETKRREQWTAATSRITHELLTNDEVDALQLIAQSVLALAGADLVAVILAVTAPSSRTTPRRTGRWGRGGHVRGATLGPARSSHGVSTPESPSSSTRSAARRWPVSSVGTHWARRWPSPPGRGRHPRVPLHPPEPRRALLQRVRPGRGRLAGGSGRAGVGSCRCARDPGATATLEDRDRIARDLHDTWCSDSSPPASTFRASRPRSAKVHSPHG